VFLSAVSRVDPKGRLRGLGRKVGSACEEFEDSEGGILGYCFLEFWCRLTRVVPEEGLFSGSFCCKIHF